MAITNSILNYRRFLKRRNCSCHTVKNYMNTLKHFVLWIAVPIEKVTNKDILAIMFLSLYSLSSLRWKQVFGANGGSP